MNSGRIGICFLTPESDSRTLFLDAGRSLDHRRRFFRPCGRSRTGGRGSWCAPARAEALPGWAGALFSRSCNRLRGGQWPAHFHGLLPRDDSLPFDDRNSGSYPLSKTLDRPFSRPPRQADFAPVSRFAHTLACHARCTSIAKSLVQREGASCAPRGIASVGEGVGP